MTLATELHYQEYNKKLKKRRELCEDLYYLIKEDKDIAEELIDEYVYLLDDDRVEELIELCKNEEEIDSWPLLTTKSPRIQEQGIKERR